MRYFLVFFWDLVGWQSMGMMSSDNAARIDHMTVGQQKVSCCFRHADLLCIEWMSEFIQYVCCLPCPTVKTFYRWLPTNLPGTAGLMASSVQTLRRIWNNWIDLKRKSSSCSCTIRWRSGLRTFLSGASWRHRGSRSGRVGMAVFSARERRGTRLAVRGLPWRGLSWLYHDFWMSKELH